MARRTRQEQQTPRWSSALMRVKVKVKHESSVQAFSSNVLIRMKAVRSILVKYKSKFLQNSFN